MERNLLAMSLGFVGLIILVQQAAAAQCAPRDQVVAGLATGFDETRRMIGLAGPAQLVEVFASESGSWTITATGPDGITCLVTSGQGFETTAENLPAKGDPA